MSPRWMPTLAAFLVGRISESFGQGSMCDPCDRNSYACPYDAKRCAFSREWRAAESAVRVCIFGNSTHAPGDRDCISRVGQPRLDSACCAGCTSRDHHFCESLARGYLLARPSGVGLQSSTRPSGVYSSWCIPVSREASIRSRSRDEAAAPFTDDTCHPVTCRDDTRDDGCPLMPPPPPPPPSPPKPCSDAADTDEYTGDDFCSRKKESGKCRDRSVQQQCRQTCGLCCCLDAQGCNPDAQSVVEIVSELFEFEWSITRAKQQNASPACDKR